MKPINVIRTLGKQGQVLHSNTNTDSCSDSNCI